MNDFLIEISCLLIDIVANACWLCSKANTTFISSNKIDLLFVYLVAAWIVNNKLITALSVVLLAFFISTVVLGTQKSSLTEELDDCLAKKHEQTTTTTTAATTTSTTATSTTVTTPTTSPTTTVATVAPEVVSYKDYCHICSDISLIGEFNIINHIVV